MAGIKRNLHEMYNNNNNNNTNNTNINTNGGGLSSNIIDLNDSQQLQANDYNNKKIKIDNRINTDPSRVVHLRNIPSQLTENEIIYLGLYFGNVINVLFLRSKNQTFLEFELINDAQSMITYFNATNTQLTFHGKKIFVQYSNHQSLQTDPNNSNNQIAQLALDSARQLFQCAKKGNANTVLRASILNMLYPVTIDVINQIFSKFGSVLKIITFNKNDKFQVLIQMKDTMGAQQAKISLNGQNIYNGCCTLQIDFSKLTCLEVRYNNDKSRDYTNLLLASSGTGASGGGGGGGSVVNDDTYSSSQQSSMSHTPQQSIIGIPPSHSNQMLNQVVQTYTHPNTLQQHNHHHHQQQQPQQHQQQHQHQQQQHIMQQQQIQTPVLLISNLNEEVVTPDSLFTLFGVYGDVLRVKILFNKKDSALIQFSNLLQAQTAMHNLDRAKLWNKQVRVFPSKHVNVQMPKEGQPDAGLTKDFTNSPLHRFKKPGSKNFNNIYPPSPTLHLSNLPNSIQENELRQVFATYGNIRAFKFFQKDRKMALIQMDTAEEAVHALIGTHNYQLADNMHLRVTFSKATI